MVNKAIMAAPFEPNIFAVQILYKTPRNMDNT